MSYSDTEEREKPFLLLEWTSESACFFADIHIEAKCNNLTSCYACECGSLTARILELM